MMSSGFMNTQVFIEEIYNFLVTGWKGLLWGSVLVKGGSKSSCLCAPVLVQEDALLFLKHPSKAVPLWFVWPSQVTRTYDVRVILLCSAL